MYSLRSYRPEDIFKFVSVANDNKVYPNFLGYRVNLTSSRLILFKQSPSCICCGITGNEMILEFSGNPSRYKGALLPDIATYGNPHFNLYYNDGYNKVLMTKDHIIPKSSYGKDDLSNYQTMCLICNNIKSNYKISIEELKNARHIYNMNLNNCKHKVSHNLAQAYLKASVYGDCI